MKNKEMNKEEKIETAKENINKLITYTYKDGIKKLFLIGMIGILSLKVLDSKVLSIPVGLDVKYIKMIIYIIFIIGGYAITKKRINQMRKLRIFKIHIEENN